MSSAIGGLLACVKARIVCRSYNRESDQFVEVVDLNDLARLGMK